MSHIELQNFVKRPAENRDVTIDFTPALPSGVTVSSFVTGYPKATKLSDGSDATATVIAAGSSVTSPKATVKTTAGTSGEDYKLTARVNFSNSEIAEHSVIMRVEDA